MADDSGIDDLIKGHGPEFSLIDVSNIPLPDDNDSDSDCCDYSKSNLDSPAFYDLDLDCSSIDSTCLDDYTDDQVPFIDERDDFEVFTADDGQELVVAGPRMCRENGLKPKDLDESSLPEDIFALLGSTSSALMKLKDENNQQLEKLRAEEELLRQEIVALSKDRGAGDVSEVDSSMEKTAESRKIKTRLPLLPPRPLKICSAKKTVISAPRPLKASTVTDITPAKLSKALPSRPHQFVDPLHNRFGERQALPNHIRYSLEDLTDLRRLANQSPVTIFNRQAFEKIRSKSWTNLQPKLNTSMDNLLSAVKSSGKKTQSASSLLSRQMSQINGIFTSRRDIEPIEQRRPRSVNSTTNMTSTPLKAETTVGSTVLDEGLALATRFAKIDVFDLTMVYQMTYEEQYKGMESEGRPCSYCYVCHLAFGSKVLLYHHCEREHGDKFRIPPMMRRCRRQQYFQLLFAESRKSTARTAGIQAFIKNCHPSPVLIERMFAMHGNKYKRIDISLKARKLHQGNAYQFVIERANLATDRDLQPILVFFRDDGVQCVELHYIMIQRDRTAYWKRRLPQRQVVIDPIRPKKMPEFRPSIEIINMYNQRFEITEDCSLSDHEKEIVKKIISFANEDPATRLNAENYVEMMTYCVEIADCAQERGMMCYDQQLEQKTLQKLEDQLYAITIDTSIDLPADLAENDFVTFLIGSEAGPQTPGREKWRAQVVKIESDSIIVRTLKDDTGSSTIHLSAPKFRLRFKNNRVPIKMERMALNVVRVNELAPLLFPSAVPQVDFKPQNLEWFDSRIGQNPEQAQAVQHIVSGTAMSAPYVIFGPPGTGKTATVVEAICQLWKTAPKSKILVTAQSNAACDEIMQRLLKSIPADHLYRLFTPSMEKKFESIDDSLLAVSNLKYGMHAWPSWSDFYGFRVVVCTLITSGRLFFAKIKRKHFTHLFIDECGAATEPSAMVPIAGVMSTLGKLNGHIILAGDIKQLGPIGKSRFSQTMGYEIPLIERLMQTPLYQKQPETGAYNPLLITKLVRSFRSHPKIIEFSNMTFYDGDLVASGAPETINFAINWQRLPNPAVPVIFVPCNAESRKDAGTYSPYNMREIEIIIEYVTALLRHGINGHEIRQQDIGVISPYKRQVQKIRSELEKLEFDDVEAGTVETYQGREKPIIIISTVRSRTPTVGFLNNPKRLNVTVTRAKGLQIIIGNHMTLKTDPYWCDLLRWCAENGCCTLPIQLGQSHRLDRFKDRLGPMYDGRYNERYHEEFMGDAIRIEDFC